jgi:hypothetical protein
MRKTHIASQSLINVLLVVMFTVWMVSPSPYQQAVAAWWAAYAAGTLPPSYYPTPGQAPPPKWTMPPADAAYYAMEQRLLLLAIVHLALLAFHLWGGFPVHLAFKTDGPGVAYARPLAVQQGGKGKSNLKSGGTSPLTIADKPAPVSTSTAAPTTTPSRSSPVALAAAEALALAQPGKAASAQAQPASRMFERHIEDLEAAQASMPLDPWTCFDVEASKWGAFLDDLGFGSHKAELARYEGGSSTAAPAPGCVQVPAIVVAAVLIAATRPSEAVMARLTWLARAFMLAIAFVGPVLRWTMCGLGTTSAATAVFALSFIGDVALLCVMVPTTLPAAFAVFRARRDVLHGLHAAVQISPNTMGATLKGDPLTVPITLHSIQNVSAYLATRRLCRLYRHNDAAFFSATALVSEHSLKFCICSKFVCIDRWERSFSSATSCFRCWC